MPIYKTLQFKDAKTRKHVGTYAMPLFESDFGGSETPQLMRAATTIESLEKLYKDHSFEHVKLVTVKLEIV